MRRLLGGESVSRGAFSLTVNHTTGSALSCRYTSLSGKSLSFRDGAHRYFCACKIGSMNWQNRAGCSPSAGKARFGRLVVPAGPWVHYFENQRSLAVGGCRSRGRDFGGADRTSAGTAFAPRNEMEEMYGPSPTSGRRADGRGCFRQMGLGSQGPIGAQGTVVIRKAHGGFRARAQTGAGAGHRTF
jgi:hypothetical protein